MKSNNPYQTPGKRAEGTEPLLRWSITAVFGSAAIGGVIGLAIGALLGVFLPSYYRSVFSNGDSPSFDPVAIGVGQGLTQGIVFGACVGLALVGMHYWRSAKLEQAITDKNVD